MLTGILMLHVILNQNSPLRESFSLTTKNVKGQNLTILAFASKKAPGAYTKKGRARFLRIWPIKNKPSETHVSEGCK